MYSLILTLVLYTGFPIEIEAAQTFDSAKAYNDTAKTIVPDTRDYESVEWDCVIKEGLK